MFLPPGRLVPIRTVAPALPLIDTATAKRHLRVEHSQDDAVIDGLVAAATKHIDGFTGILGRALINQTWRQDLGCFDSCRIYLPLKPPISAVTSVTYYDASNTQRTLASSVYAGPFADGEGAFIELAYGQSWPETYSRPDAVSITFTAGYGAAASDVPEDILQGVKLLIAHWYENRETVNIGNISSSLPFGADVLFSKARGIGF